MRYYALSFMWPQVRGTYIYLASIRDLQTKKDYIFNDGKECFETLASFAATDDILVLSRDNAFTVPFFIRYYDIAKYTSLTHKGRFSKNKSIGTFKCMTDRSMNHIPHFKVKVGDYTMDFTDLRNKVGEEPDYKQKLYDFLTDDSNFTDDRKEDALHFLKADLDYLQDAYEILEEQIPGLLDSYSIASYSFNSGVEDSFCMCGRPLGMWRKKYPQWKLSDDRRYIFNKMRDAGYIEGATFNTFYTDEILSVKKYDVNNMYAYIMAYKEMPTGEGNFVRDGSKYKYNKRKVCFIHLKNVSIDMPLTITPIDNGTFADAWLPDFYVEEVIKQYGEIKYDEIIEYIEFNKIRLPGGFREMVMANYDKKTFYKEQSKNPNLTQSEKNKNSVISLLFKKLNVSLYGKFIEKPHNTSYQLNIDEAKTMKTKEVKEDLTIGQYEYMPIGFSIIFYGWQMIMDAIYKNNLDPYEDIAYIDTDCVAFINNERTANLDIEVNNEIGSWKLEAETTFRFLGPKAYMEVDKETGEIINATVAGMAEVEGYDNGYVYGTNISTKTVEGGRILYLNKIGGKRNNETRQYSL